MTDAEFTRIVTRLLGRSAPRVWSLLVTMFGDLAVAPQARLSGATVNALTAAIGIKPEATRVALHRLRKEGWIESHRTGRQTRYGLTPLGRSQTEAAWPRVYGPPAHGMAYLILEDPSAPVDLPVDKEAAVTLQIGARAFVTTSTDAREHQLRLPLEPERAIPKWVSDKLCPPDLQSASQDLERRFGMLLNEIAFEDLDLLQSTALRCVVVHEWRRLVLRSPALPDALLSEGWHGPDCRAAFRQLSKLLPVPDLGALETVIENGATG